MNANASTTTSGAPSLFTGNELSHVQLTITVQICDTCGSRSSGHASSEPMVYAHPLAGSIQAQNRELISLPLREVTRRYEAMFGLNEGEGVLCLPELPLRTRTVEQPVKFCEHCFTTITLNPDPIVLTPKFMPLPMNQLPRVVKRGPVESPNEELITGHKSTSRRLKPRDQRGTRPGPKLPTKLEDLLDFNLEGK